MNSTPEKSGIFPTPDRKPLSAQAIAQVNRAVNRYAYIQDRKQDYWQSPSEFFQNGGGDCEDFAIAKYAWLQSIGMPEDQMRIVIVDDRFVNQVHAVLMVENGRAPLVLDNQEQDLNGKLLAERYSPIFSFNRNGVWIY